MRCIGWFGAVFLPLPHICSFSIFYVIINNIYMYMYQLGSDIQAKYLGTNHLTWMRGLWFFVSFRNFFSDNTRVRIYFLLSRKVRIFFRKYNIRLYDKYSESDYFFFPPPKSEYFFQQHWESEYFFRKKNITLPPPLQVKWSFPYNVKKVWHLKQRTNIKI